MSTESHNVRQLFVILGNQLFPLPYFAPYKDAQFFMAEDVGLCTYVRHHKQKIVLFLASMRAHARAMHSAGYRVTYLHLPDRSANATYEDALGEHVKQHGVEELILFEIEDRFFAQRIEDFAKQHALRLRILPSPMFLTPRQQFADYLQADGKPFMASFYMRQRRRLKVLVDPHGRPIGGRWSFDTENRRRLPGKLPIPAIPHVKHDPTVKQVCRLVEDRFADHPGSTADFWLPTTRAQALAWLNAFLAERLPQFGDYEDAISKEHRVMFHSVLSPLLNLGLLTPSEVLTRLMDAPAVKITPINCLEGFVRQLIGWREFIHGIDQHFGEQQHQRNFWKHHRRLTNDWYAGTTGIPPLDDVIAKAQKFGWVHHIERLMIVGNLMLLCEIEPADAYRWFMEMFVDSSDWVMGPNVFGMGIFSDGGIFATKPYLCGSNYLLKMSDYPRGPWCDVVDGLYWRFIAKHRDYFERNPRLKQVTRNLDRMDKDRTTRIHAAAEQFLAHHTGPASRRIKAKANAAFAKERMSSDAEITLFSRTDNSDS